MDLIKGVKTKENFLTGERIELPYTKKAAPVRGFAKLELFDDLTGKKIEEITSENFISKYVYQYWEQLMRKSFIYHEGSKLGDVSGFSTLLPSPFQSVVLLDYDKPEDENERIAPGKIVGYARPSIYSGSDTKRGSINLVESFANAEQLHFVFDFPTHAANGTFQSIAWVADAFFGSNGVWPMFNNLTFPGSSGALKGRGLAVTNTEIYIKDSQSAKVRVYDKATFRGESSQSKKEFDLAYTNVTAMVYAMGYLWTVGAGDNKIRKVDPQTGAVVQTITPSGGSLPNRFNGITFDGVDFWVTWNNYSSSTQALVFRIGQDGTVKQAWQETNKKYWDIAYMPERDFLIIADRNDINGLQVRDKNGGWICYLDSRLLDFDHCIDYNNGEVWYTSYQQNLTKHINAGLSARTLLPSAVTKTNMNTMKVTYDFILPPYNPLYN